ncbi:MAG: hypothetical protein WKG07_12930 [Hymenobacter sp.]
MPLLAVGTLPALAHQVAARTPRPDTYAAYCPMLDASAARSVHGLYAADGRVNRYPPPTSCSTPIAWPNIWPTTRCCSVGRARPSLRLWCGRIQRLFPGRHAALRREPRRDPAWAACQRRKEFGMWLIMSHFT